MKVKSLFILSAIASAAIMTTGCRRVDNVAWSKYVDIPDEGWDPVNVIPFYPWPEDSVVNDSDRFSLIVSFHFSPLKRPAPLHLIVRQESDENQEKSDTFRIEMKIPPVTPSGRGCYGVYEVVDTIARDVRLTPGYCVELQSLSIPENTKGLSDIGLILSQEM